MMWQDLIFMAGSSLSVVFLSPTIRDGNARIPLGTSLPNMSIGAIYAVTFASLGMTLSAIGALSAATMWSIIAVLRSPRDHTPTLTRRDHMVLFGRDLHRYTKRAIGNYLHRTIATPRRLRRGWANATPSSNE